VLPDELVQANEEFSRQRRLIIYSATAIVSAGLLLLLVALRCL